MPLGLSEVDTHALAVALSALADDGAGQPSDPDAQDALAAQVQTLVYRATAGVGDETPGPDGIYPYGIGRRQPAKHTDVAMFLLALHAERPGPWLRPTAAWLVGVISEDTEARTLTYGQAPYLRTTTEAVRPYLPPGPDWLVEPIAVLATLGAFDLIAEALQRTLRRYDERVAQRARDLDHLARLLGAAHPAI